MHVFLRERYTTSAHAGSTFSPLLFYSPHPLHMILPCSLVPPTPHPRNSATPAFFPSRCRCEIRGGKGKGQLACPSPPPHFLAYRTPAGASCYFSPLPCLFKRSFLGAHLGLRPMITAPPSPILHAGESLKPLCQGGGAGSEAGWLGEHAHKLPLGEKRRVTPGCK